MHHKRRRPKNRRAGCLMCKPWKINGVSRNGSNYKPSERCKVQEGPDENGDRQREQE